MARLKRASLIAIILTRGLIRITRRRKKYRPELHYMRGPGPATKARLLKH